ncbi:unnamed protein product (macronuclear) [Paramecium tetraurelia]|uniref:Uncharacterized protein n=1 Tax=Paramecium tetraurelia TaxID=5888 RepID=A0CQB6_PARTE|nr:uncharacterized protein GSPATT00009331001 [Paramecium tetraurelia]CAK72983.1 unnamed protein product [Paramecium tetraurelia]|eukprot:XP_001440380.1 hypothetical protein (macronuclear) [Paramecium tetraurelia strain d4-2]
MGCSINKKKLSCSTSINSTKTTNDNFEQYLKSVGSLAEFNEIRRGKVPYQISKNPIILRRMNKSKEKLDDIDQDKMFVN